MRISDWSSDVCSSDLVLSLPGVARRGDGHAHLERYHRARARRRTSTNIAVRSVEKAPVGEPAGAKGVEILARHQHLVGTNECHRTGFDADISERAVRREARRVENGRASGREQGSQYV